MNIVTSMNIGVVLTLLYFFKIIISSFLLLKYLHVKKKIVGVPKGHFQERHLTNQ